MDSRSKKYHEKKSKDDGSKKGSASKAGYDEQNQKSIKAPKENPAPSAKEDESQAQVSKNNATQDDTGGDNNTNH